jgi:hypothetical protein
MRTSFVFVTVVLAAGSAWSDDAHPESPLASVLQRALAGYERMETEIRDYTCILTKREHIDGRLHGPETIYLKVRHEQLGGENVEQPVSVYLRFLRPAAVREREVIYVEGRHKGKMIVRNGGLRLPFVTTTLPPQSAAAMQESRYPITEIGVKTLTERLIEVGKGKLQDENCETQVVAGAKINGRVCTLIQVGHRERRDDHTFQFVRVFIDDELELPVYYVAYDWPAKPGDPPVMLEEYTYTDIKLNVGLTDWDFDHRNEHYLFLKSFTP